MLAEVESHGNDFENTLNIDDSVEDGVGLNNETVHWCHILVVSVVLRSHQHRVEQNACDDEHVKPLLVHQPHHVEPKLRIVVIALKGSLFGTLDLDAIEPEDVPLVSESLLVILVVLLDHLL